jgi:uncharacterized protein (PEP-CTERM system associated)
VTNRRGRIQGHFDYSVSGLALGGSSSDNDLRHQLNSGLSAELIEDHLFVDAAASIARRLISPFGLQTSDSRLPNSNQTDFRSLSLSPVLRGSIGGRVDYAARVTYATADGSGDAFDSTTLGASLSLSGGTGFRALSWTLVASHDDVDLGPGRQFVFDQLRGQVNFAVTPELQVSAIGGHEANDLRTVDKQGYNNVGWAIDWRPSVRTKVFAERERRYFGVGHKVLMEHRTARTIWRFSDRRDVSNPRDTQALAVIGTVFDLFYAQFAAVEPDPVLRQALVTNFLLANGIDPSTPLFGSFLASSLALIRDQQLSVGWNHPRYSVTLAVQQSWTRRADTLANAPDDFSNTTLVRQRGLTVSASYRLTPISSVGLEAQLTRNSGDVALLATTLRSLQSTWSSELNDKMTGSIGVRLTRFSGVSQSYTESAVLGSLTMRF